MGSLGDIQFELDGSFTLTVPVVFTRPILKLSIFGNPKGPEGYVVNMERLPVKGLSDPKRLTRHFLDFIYWEKLQQGFGYYLCKGLPLRVLNSLRILRDSGCLVGYDIDDRGIINYCEGYPNV